MEITMNQASNMMDTICEKMCNMIGRAIFLTDGSLFTAEYMTPEINKATRECFCTLCDILGIETVKEEVG